MRGVVYFQTQHEAKIRIIYYEMSTPFLFMVELTGLQIEYPYTTHCARCHEHGFVLAVLA